MRDDTDTDIHDDGYEQAERPADDRHRVATSDTERMDPVEGDEYPARPADDRSTDDAEVLEPSAAEDDRDLRSGDEPQPTAAAMTDEPAPAARAGEPAASPDRVDSTELMPGQAPVEPAATGWTKGAAEGMRARWQELQLRFVDDPSGVAGEARALVAEAVQGLTNALAEEQRQLDSWSPDEGGDTEQLRVIVQRYRDFFDRMLERAV
jgi:hypothetical protein